MAMQQACACLFLASSLLLATRVDATFPVPIQTLFHGSPAKEDPVRRLVEKVIKPDDSVVTNGGSALSLIETQADMLQKEMKRYKKSMNNVSGEAGMDSANFPRFVEVRAATSMEAQQVSLVTLYKTENHDFLKWMSNSSLALICALFIVAEHPHFSLAGPRKSHPKAYGCN